MRQWHSHSGRRSNIGVKGFAYTLIFVAVAVFLALNFMTTAAELPVVRPNWNYTQSIGK